MQQQNGKMLKMLQCLNSKNRDEISLKVGFLRDDSFFIYAWLSFSVEVYSVWQTLLKDFGLLLLLVGNVRRV